MSRPLLGLFPASKFWSFSHFSFDLPTDAGAHVLGTADHTMLVCPWATSPIYYIGKAENLHERLLTHRKYVLGAMDDYWDRW